MYRPYLSQGLQTASVIPIIPVWVPVGEATIPPACLLSSQWPHAEASVWRQWKSLALPPKSCFPSF